MLPAFPIPRYFLGIATTMRSFVALFLLSCTLGAAQASRTLQAPSYPTISDALNAAANANLTTLLAALKAANLTVPAGATWTIFAPTDAAFASADIQAKTGLTAAQLLLPEYKDALVSVLSYHVVPSAAVASTQLTNGQQLPTALASATPLTVALADGTVRIKTSAADEGAKVVGADVKAGSSIIHVIDKVLIPPSLVKPEAQP